jgi:transcriptional regulator with XRE-family HTH domain
MKRQNITAMAKANGVSKSTAHRRIENGWSEEKATSTPARKYQRPKKSKLRYGQKADAVWAYLVTNPLARPAEVAKATGVSYGYVYNLMSKVGTPREVFEAEAAAKANVTEDVSLEQFVKDDTSPFPPRGLLIGVIVVAVLVAMVLFG